MIDNFITFSLESKNYDRPMSSIQNRSVKCQLSAVESFEKVRLHIEQLFNRYKEEFGYHQINIACSENVALHIARIHRILAYSHW